MEFDGSCQSEEVAEVIIVVAVQEYRIEVKVEACLGFVPDGSKTGRVEFLNSSSLFL